MNILEQVQTWLGFKKAEETIPEPTGLALDISDFVNRKGDTSVLVKPTRISFHTLRMMSRSNAVIRLCIDTLKHQISRTNWDIVPIDEEEDPAIYQKQIDTIKAILKRPNRNNETFRTLTEKVVEDLLALDQADVEIVRNATGEPCELYALDAATIRPVYNKFGQYQDPAYLQYLPSNKTMVKPDASFAMDDIIHMMQSPMTDTKSFGYGLSPIEAIIGVATNYLNADLYQGNIFDNGTFADQILNLGKNVQAPDVKAFREYWRTEVTGKANALPIIGGSEAPEILRLKDSPKDAQFMEYLQWLARLIVGAYGLSPQDIGLNLDQYKAEGQVQAQISQRKGYASLLDILAEYINQELVWEAFGDLDDTYSKIKFTWIDVDEVDELSRAQTAQTEISIGAKTINEYRSELGLEAVDGGDRPFILGGTPTYFDAQAQQEKVDQQLQEQSNLEMQMQMKKEAPTFMASKSKKKYNDEPTDWRTRRDNPRLYSEDSNSN